MAGIVEMDEQISRLVIDEIKGIRLYFYFYLTAVFLWCYLKPESVSYKLINSWILVFAILICMYYIRRDFTNEYRIKKYCIFVGVIIELWSVNALYVEYNLNVFFIFLLSVLGPALWLKRFTFFKKTPRECLLFFIGYYLILFFAIFVLFQTLLLLYLFFAVCTALFLSDSWKALHRETTSYPHLFQSMRPLLFQRAEAFFLVIFCSDALNLYSMPSQPKFNLIMPLYALMYIIFDSEFITVMLFKKDSELKNP
jgi:hypothetical protein